MKHARKKFLIEVRRTSFVTIEVMASNEEEAQADAAADAQGAYGTNATYEIVKTEAVGAGEPS